MDDVTSVRVVRGPDWSTGNEDGGDGHLGTVVDIKPTADGANAVVILWDNGKKREYRYGSEGNYTLRVFDNAPASKLLKKKSVTCHYCCLLPVVVTMTSVHNMKLENTFQSSSFCSTDVPHPFLAINKYRSYTHPR